MDGSGPPVGVGFGTVFAGGWLLFGLCFAAAGVAILHHRAALSGRTMGTVIEVPRGADGMYRARIRFTAGDQSYEVTSSSATSWPAYRVGDEAPVRYDPGLPGADPDVGGTIVFGLAFLLGGLVPAIPALVYFLSRGAARRAFDRDRQRELEGRLFAMVLGAAGLSAGAALILGPLVASRLEPTPPMGSTSFAMMAAGAVAAAICLFFARNARRSKLAPEWPE